MFHPRNARLLADLELFVVATRQSQRHLDLGPFGLAVAEDARVDPLHRDAAPFLDLLARLDAVTFGPERMAMPRWIYYDCAEIPGAIVGFGARGVRVSSAARALFDAPAGHAGLAPYAMYIAIPTLEPGTWMGHNLATVADLVDDGALRGLGGLTKAVALKVFRASAQIGVTQWSSLALHVHTRLGPLDLLTAWTPAHIEVASLTYRAAIDDAALRHLARDPLGHVERPALDRWIDSADHGALEALQKRIEAGERFRVVGAPIPSRPGGSGCRSWRRRRAEREAPRARQRLEAPPLRCSPLSAPRRRRRPSSLREHLSVVSSMAYRPKPQLLQPFGGEVVMVVVPRLLGVETTSHSRRSWVDPKACE